MDMKTLKYLIDKLGKHKLAMDIIMGVSMAFHYESSGGLLKSEFESVIGENYGSVMESLVKNGTIYIDGDMVCIGSGLQELKKRAEEHFSVTKGEVIDVF
ncbi:MAG: hypothetical protein ACRCX8_20015 [Sarcina sp.]